MGTAVPSSETTEILKLRWTEPRWSYTRKLWMQFQHILNPTSLLHIGLSTLALAAAVIAGLKWAVPQFAIPNLWPMVLAFPAILLLLAVQFGILTLIPPIVTVRRDKILVQHGQSATVIDTKNVTATRLTFHSRDRIRLRIDYSYKTKSRFRVVGVPADIDFEQLSLLLPIAPSVHDARNRNALSHASREQHA